MTDKKEPAPESEQDLRRLERRVSLLGICNLIQALIIGSLLFKINEIVSALNSITENIRLLTLRLDLLVEINDNVAQIIGDVLQLIGLQGL